MEVNVEGLRYIDGIIVRLDANNEEDKDKLTKILEFLEKRGSKAEVACTAISMHYSGKTTSLDLRIK